jgi:hypothetical protein
MRLLRIEAMAREFGHIIFVKDRMPTQLSCAVIVFVLLAPFIFATSPALPPYHQFRVNGRIERPGGGMKGNFTVALLGKPVYQTQSGQFEIMRGIGKQDDRPIALTDSSGSFYLVTSNYNKPDSIVVGIIVPERNIIYGSALAVRQLQSYPNTETRDYYDQDQSGCNGCQTTPQTQTVTTHYSYSILDQIVTVNY